jgi:hypothetical protein
LFASSIIPELTNDRVLTCPAPARCGKSNSITIDEDDAGVFERLL